MSHSGYQKVIPLESSIKLLLEFLRSYSIIKEYQLQDFAKKRNLETLNLLLNKTSIIFPRINFAKSIKAIKRI